MISRIGIFLLATFAGALIFYLPMQFMVKEPPAEVIALSAAVCVVPGLAVLFAAHQLREKPAEVKIIGVLLSTIFRMVACLGGGVLLYNALPIVKEHATVFISWCVVFYLVTLFIETGLLYTDTSGPSGTFRKLKSD